MHSTQTYSGRMINTTKNGISIEFFMENGSSFCWRIHRGHEVVVAIDHMKVSGNGVVFVVVKKPQLLLYVTFLLSLFMKRSEYGRGEKMYSRRPPCNFFVLFLVVYHIQALDCFTSIFTYNITGLC